MRRWPTLLVWSAHYGEVPTYSWLMANGGNGCRSLSKGKRVRSCQASRRLDIREYINDMPDCLAAADLVICRAGAITLSELQAQGKRASILIPSPNVAENHQYHNAMALVNRGACCNLGGKRPERGSALQKSPGII